MTGSMHTLTEEKVASSEISNLGAFLDYRINSVVGRHGIEK